MAEREPAPLDEVFVGPRPFERSEHGLFFGRDREISELLSLVISSRAVLCYAPSGAGKTSLINAGLHPRLEEEGFEVLPSTRVRGLVPEGVDREQVPNIYIFNTLLSLTGEGSTPGELPGRTLAMYLSARPHKEDEDGFPAPRILIFDQFEELLTAYPECWQERETFFEQVREALEADPFLRVLFVIREDFLARIEPFLRQLKPFQQARFRLALLGTVGARAAVNGPLRGTGRRFKEGVDAALIEELRKVRVETALKKAASPAGGMSARIRSLFKRGDEAAGGETMEVVGEYVEPVQLQVVCATLWASLPPDVEEISAEHLQAYGNVDQALQHFYESCLAEAKTGLGAKELKLRQWFEERLITPAGTRSIVFRGAQATAGLANAIVDFLENRHLIRGEWRAGSRWYELTHDRFIEPIQQANGRWRARRLARRNSLLQLAVVPLLLALLWFAAVNTGLFYDPVQANNQAQALTAVVTEQSIASTAVAQATQANQNVSLANSRQLAAQALLQQDRTLSILLAIAANREADTLEARRSLHTILSTRPAVDGTFLREFNPAVVAPRLVKRMLEHRSAVTSVAFSPDGRRFLSGSTDTTLILWDLATLEPAGAPWDEHSSNVLSVDFSPDGTMAASAGLDSQVMLWDVFSGTRIATMPGHTGLITCLAFSPDGRWLATGGEDALVRIWDVSAERVVALLSYPSAFLSLAWSPDGKNLATGGSEGELTLWSIDANGQAANIGELTGQPGRIRSLAWSPDGRTLAAGSVVEQGSRSAGSVLLWDTDSREVIAQPSPENLQPVREVAFYPGGELLAIGREDGTITLWDTRSQSTLGEPLKAHDHWVMSIAFSPDGRYMISGSIDQTVALWDLYAPTGSIAFSPAGDRLAASQGQFVSLWDPADPTDPLAVLTGHSEDVLALAFSPDGSLLASAGQDDTIRLWDGESGNVIGPPMTGHDGDVLALAFNPDGTLLASAGQDGKAILWDLAARQLGGVLLYQHGSPLITVQFEGEGGALQAAASDGSLVTLDLATGAGDVQALPGTQKGLAIADLAFRKDGRGFAFFQEAGAFAGSEGARAHGIEITSFNQSFDPSVNPDDIDFIVIRAAVGMEVESRFEEFVEASQPVPIRGASYWYTPGQPWQEQADLFLSLVQDKGFHFFTLDLELKPDTDRAAYQADVQNWLRYVDERVEQKILIQTGAYFYNEWLAPGGEWAREWPLLIMSYNTEPDRNAEPFLLAGMEGWAIWQYSETGLQAADYGLGGNPVYAEVFNGTALEMWEWLEVEAFWIYDLDSDRIIRPSKPVRVSGSNSLAYSPDNSFLAAAGGNAVAILDAGTGEQLSALVSGGRQFTSLAYQPDGRVLAAGSDNGRIFLWDLDLLNEHRDPEPTLAVACSLVGRNPRPNEWEQFFPGQEVRPPCPEFPASRGSFASVGDQDN